MKQDKPLNFEQIKKNALEHLRSGKWLFGSDGAFASLFKGFTGAAVQAKPKSSFDKGERYPDSRKNANTGIIGLNRRKTKRP